VKKLPPPQENAASGEADELYVWQAMRCRELKNHLGEDAGSWFANDFVDRFLRTLAQHPPEEWSDESWDIIKSCTREFGDEFWRRLAMGTTDLVKRRLKAPPDDRRTRTISFLQDNWEALQFPNPDNKPGLREWHPDVVIELLKAKGLKHYSRKTYEKLRQKLHLKPSRTYTVKAPKT
jgi:hypothetical protein